MFKPENIALKFFLICTAVEGIFVGVTLGGRRNPAGEFFFNSGFTLKNFLLLSATTLFVGLLISFLISKKLFRDFQDRLMKTLENEEQRQFLVLILFYLLVDFGLAIVFAYSEFDTYIILDYSEFVLSLLPFQIWGAAATAQLLILITVELKFDLQKLTSGFQSIRKHLLVFAVLGIPWLLNALIGFGFIPGSSRDEVRSVVGRFLPVTKPIPGGQVVLIFILLLAAGWVISKISSQQKWEKSSWILTGVSFLMIWSAAYLLWSSAPIEPNYMIDRPPYDPATIYPSSDGFYYDKEANRLLSGLGFDDDTTHVMYSTFVGMLHLLVGFDYQQVIRLQLAVLAVIPVLLYQFGRELDRPLTGWFTALLFITRERNGLLLGEELAGPLANQLLSENVALLGVVIFCFLIYRWVSNPRNKSWLPPAAGGVLGIFILIRAEFLALLLVTALTSLYILWGKRKIWFRGMVGMLLVVGLIITPWVIRNYQRTGLVYLDKAGYVSKRIEVFQGKSIEDDPQPILVENGGGGEDYGGSIQIFTKHVVHSLNHLVMYLPSGYQPFWGVSNLISTDGMGKSSLNREALTGLLYFSEDYLELHARLLPYYWYDWNGKIPLINIIPAAGSLFLIALGLVRIFNRKPNAVLVLLGILGAQILIWAFANYSGSRHVKPVDWISLFFYAAGFMELSRLILNRLGTKLSFLKAEIPEPGSTDFIDQKNRVRFTTGMLSVGLLVIIGLSPIWIERVFPVEFTEEQKLELVSKLSRNQDLAADAPEACAPFFTDLDPDRILYGRALYPRFFEEGERYPDSRKGTVPESYGDRIDFYLLGPETIWGSLPADSSEEIFPPRSMVLLLGEKVRNSYINNFTENQDYFLTECLFLVEENQDPLVGKFSPAAAGPR